MVLGILTQMDSDSGADGSSRIAEEHLGVLLRGQERERKWLKVSLFSG